MLELNLLLSMKCLPETPKNKRSWPWGDVVFSQLPETMSEGNPWPCISIVTPSYNQGQFIEETIRSVLLQGYPNLEYIIVDGGSSDDSVEIIKKYEPWLAYWISEPDRGQSHAINKGWSRATGDIIAYLNSDDTYMPSALAHVAHLWRQNPKAAVWVGAVAFVDEGSSLKYTLTPRLPGLAPLDLTIIDREKWSLPQQSGFYNRTILDQVGCFLREDLHYSMDRELYYRLALAGSVVLSDVTLATYRLHEESKSVAKVLEMYQEAPRALKYIETGSFIARIKRHRIGRSIIGEGYYRRAKIRMSILEKAFDLTLAAYFRPKYLGSRGYWSTLAEVLGLLRIYHWIRTRNILTANES
jgi:glycosyltransferase involved in cell wall biosynthesis